MTLPAQPLTATTSTEPQSCCPGADLRKVGRLTRRLRCGRRVDVARHDATGPDARRFGGANQLLEADAEAEFGAQFGLLVGEQIADIAEFVGEVGFPCRLETTHKDLLGQSECNRLRSPGLAVSHSGVPMWGALEVVVKRVAYVRTK